MKTYSAASTDLWDAIERMRTEYHPELKGVTVAALFVFDEEHGKQVLKLNGYWCAAVVSITPIKQRALGVADAVIIVDRSCWLTYGPARRDALIDHELQHLLRVVAPPSETSAGGPVYDAVNRPKLTARRHDHELGWFDEVARRHGEESMEVRQARELVNTTQQLYFSFAEQKSGRPKGGKSTLAAAHTLKDGRVDVAIVGADGWPKWSESNQRFENKNGTTYEGPLARPLSDFAAPVT